MSDEWRLTMPGEGNRRGTGNDIGLFPGGLTMGLVSPVPGLSGGAKANVQPQGIANGIVQWWEQMNKGQDQFMQHVLDDLSAMEGGFGGMFDNLLTTGNNTFDRLGGNLMQMGQSLIGGLTKQGGSFSFLGSAFSGVQSALGFLNPVTSVLSTGLSLFKGIKGLFGGRKTQWLASPLVNRSDYKPQSLSAPAQQAGRTVNVYINGQTLGSAIEVDRTLGRAGVDRRLRDQVKELVRSGANPMVS